MPTTSLLLALSLASGTGLHSAAKALWERAGAAYAAGRYEEALEEFQAAYALQPLPELLFDAGQCDRMLGRWREALSSFRRFLKAKPNASNRPIVEGRIAEAEAELRAAGPAAPPAAGPPPRPTPTADAPRLASPSPLFTRPALAAPAPALTAAAPGHRSAAPGWMLIGGGAAALAGGLLFGQAALGAQLSGNRTVYTEAQADAARTRGYVGQGIGYAGVVVAAAGLIWLLERPAETAP